MNNNSNNNNTTNSRSNSGIKSAPSSQQKSTNTSTNTTTAIDPDQLLSLCHRINENLSKLDKSIHLIRLRFVTLNYVVIDNGHDPWPANCLTDLIELCKLSELLVNQLDQLHSKLNDNPQSSISFHIGSQQLAYFTSEWYENLTPKFQQTLAVADRYIDLASGNRAAARQKTKGKKTIIPIDESNRLRVASSTTSVEIRVQEALMRLKQSMGENEQLIASISNNLEYTKTTMETIYGSLQATRGQLNKGEKNTIESIGIIRQSSQTKMVLMLVCFTIITIIILILFRLIGIL